LIRVFLSALLAVDCETAVDDHKIGTQISRN
jgi:hypothetical protein